MIVVSVRDQAKVEEETLHVITKKLRLLMPD
jgi:hypothetical protein